MGSRAASAAKTQERIRDAATALFWERSYDEVSLEDVARRAGVSLPTVLRKFGSKDALFVACVRAFSERELVARTVSAGDVRGVARVLARQYEKLLPVWKRGLDVEGRIPAVADGMAQAREGHLAWLSEAFTPFLSRRPGKLRARQLAALFGATEIYLWWTWRTHLHLAPGEAEKTMFEVLDSLVRGWPPQG
ncbi:MAG TPA: helix-turn-helix domain-containing protein [Myxococcales bacterium]|nr:helix-turn-helix domain-containing protein [Myxococcales bacterium]